MKKHPAALLQQSSLHWRRNTTRRLPKSYIYIINPSKYRNVIHTFDRYTSIIRCQPQTWWEWGSTAKVTKNSPFPPTKQKIDRPKYWLLKHFAKTAFKNNRVFPLVSGPAADTHLKEGAVPKARHKPIPVSFHFKEPVRQAFWEDMKKDIITPLPAGMSTDRSSTMVITAKKKKKWETTTNCRLPVL